MTTPTGKRKSLMNRWVVPWWIGVVVIAILGGSIALAFRQLSADRHAAMYNSAFAACESSNEFRSFMSQYLTSQIGHPVQEVPGFDALPPESQQLVNSLGPVLDAGREQRAAFAAQYVAQFPVRDCVQVATAASSTTDNSDDPPPRTGPPTTVLPTIAPATTAP